VVPTQSPTPQSRKSLISSIASPSKHVWGWIVGSSRPSPPYPQVQAARGLSWRPPFSSWPNTAASPRRTERSKALRLACRNADGMRGRKLELEHFRSQHGVDICLLIETFLNPGQAFRLPNYVCHRTDRPTAGGGTAILVRRGIVHYSVPVPVLTHLEATAIQVTLAGRPVKILWTGHPNHHP